jgi:hypothetical protein
MEDWEFEFEWLKVRHTVQEAFRQDRLPDLNLVLLLIGIQELGRWQKRFSKEEKQDLMHIAVCTLLSEDGYYEFVGRDTEGWPHFNVIRALEIKGEKAQEYFLKTKIIEYFKSNQDVNQ